MQDWLHKLGLGRESVVNSLRTAVAAVISLLVARGLKLPEFYWAPLTTIVVLLSTIHPMTLAWQRFVGTAVGVTLGALIASFFKTSWVLYGVGIFVCGILSAVLRLGNAYRFVAMALTIVLLAAKESTPWEVATHRFIEVSLGIAVALLVTLIWRVPQKPAA